MADVTLVVDQLRRAVPGGIGTYIRGLLLGLERMGDDAPEVTLFAGRPDRRPDPLAVLGFPTRTSRWPTRVLTRAWDSGLLTGVGGAGVVHASSLAAPFAAGRSTVVTVHDLAWRDVPDTFPARGRRWHEAALARCMEHAAVVVTPSPEVAARLAGLRIETIPEGSDHLPPPDHPGAEQLLQSLGVVTPYLLSVSTLEPRKNLVRLMDAYALAVDALPEAWPLVVAGAAGWGPALPPRPGVKLAGPVSGAVLAALYAGARCLAYVPLTEGWGLPPVEAMAACTPVVASPMPSIGDAAVVVDPTEPESIAAGLLAAAADDRRRSGLVTAGLLRSGELTWEAAARRHVEVWESLP